MSEIAVTRKGFSHPYLRIKLGLVHYIIHVYFSCLSSFNTYKHLNDALTITSTHAHSWHFVEYSVCLSRARDTFISILFQTSEKTFDCQFIFREQWPLRQRQPERPGLRCV